MRFVMDLIKIIYVLTIILRLNASAQLLLQTLWCCIDIKTINKPAYRVCHKCDKNYLSNSMLTVHILRFNTSAQMLLHTLWCQSDNKIISKLAYRVFSYFPSAGVPLFIFFFLIKHLTYEYCILKCSNTREYTSVMWRVRTLESILV